MLYSLRHPGIEPGPHAWEARILTTELMALLLYCQHAKVYVDASSRARTGDLSVNSRPLCQLSHGSVECVWLIIIVHIIAYM